MFNNFWIKTLIKIICGLLWLTTLTAVAAPIKLTDINVSQGGANARIQFFLNKATRYHIFSLENPDRLVIDFDQTALATHLNKILIQGPTLKTVRSGHPNADTLRLVFDLNKPVKYQDFSQSNKIILDVYAQNQSIPSPHPIPRIASVETTSAIKPVVIAKPAKNQTIIIVIDPGHGGKDPGAIGQDGTKEKNVVLAIAQRLARLINQQPNLHAVLTRDGDYFVPLRERLKLARRGRADIFMSIHADSFYDDRSTGVSVYALSHHGATTEAARWLARRENTSELGGVDLGELGDKSVVLRSVLIDLAQTATTTDSLRLGVSILNSLDNMTELHYTRVEQAPFVVLKSPDIPSILVETGFISNPSEEAKLRSENYQNKIAQALLNGIGIYLKRYSMMSV